MRIPCQIIGAISVADGFFTALFSRNYIRRFWGGLDFGPEWRNTIEAYAAFPDRALRIIGVAELLIGVAMLVPGCGEKETTPD